MSDHWTVLVEIDGEPRPAQLLSVKGATVGRAKHAGVHLSMPWVSTVQVMLHLRGANVIAVNGTRTRMRVSSRRLSAMAERGAAVLLQAGTNGPVGLSWPELDGHLKVRLEWGTGAVPALRLATDRPPHASPYIGTAATANNLRIEPELRHRMAVLFQHLIDDTPPPRNLYRHAAAPLGMTEQSLKAAATRLMSRINEGRWENIRGRDSERRRDNEERPGNDLQSAEALGYYLVRMTRVVTEKDLAGPTLSL